MSSATKSRTIKFISKMGTYTAMIQSPSGDLYQEYKGNTSENPIVSPDFSQTQPKLYFVCMSSRVAEGISTPVSMRYSFNDTEITFDSNGKSTGLMAGLFEIIRPSAEQLYWGLKIVKSLAQASGFAPIVIKMQGKIQARNQQTDITDELQAIYTIPVGPDTGTAYRVTIMAGDNKVFNLSSATDSCILMAKAMQSSVELTQGLTYKWYKAVNTASGWELITSATSKSLTVKAADVDCTRDFKVEVYKGSELLGYDFQGVTDSSDPYDIDCSPNPSDETIEEDETGNGSVVYTPKLVVRGTTTPITSKFFFTLKSPSGVVLNTESGRKPTDELSSFTVTRADCIKGGYCDISLSITSKE